MSAAELDTIEKAAQMYFDGMFDSDATLLKKVFHPQALITGFTGKKELLVMSAEEFADFAGSVPSAKAEGGKYDMEILSIDVTGKVAAVKVRNLYMKRDFTDQLQMVETDKGWRIISKVYHSVPAN